MPLRAAAFCAWGTGGEGRAGCGVDQPTRSSESSLIFLLELLQALDTYRFEQLLLARANGISVAISKTDVEMVDLLGILSTYDISSNVGIQD